MQTVDLNCDMGESSSVYEYDMLKDLELLKQVSSINIACGLYAGDVHTMRELVTVALQLDVAVGAHPGFDDAANFGRSEIALPPNQIYNLVLYQLGALDAFLRPHGERLHHIKLHGALYNMSARDASVADAVACAARDFDDHIIVYGLCGSEMIRSAGRHGLQSVHEVFADRTYRPDGSLSPRNLPDALIEDEGKAVQQVLEMVQSGSVTATTGEKVPVRAETICIHGDGIHALALAQSVRRALIENDIVIRCR